MFFVNNGNGGTASLDSAVQYNGFTVPFTATIEVKPFQTYHIKIAIADGSDGYYDSALLLQGDTTSYNYINATVDNSSITCGQISSIKLYYELS